MPEDKKEEKRDNSDYHNVADMEGVSVDRISMTEIFVAIGILLIVLLIGGASYVLWLSKNAQDSYYITLQDLTNQAANTVNPGSVTRRIDTNSWGIYENNNYRFQIKYPTNLQVFEELTEEELNGYQAEDAVVIKDTDSTSYLTILINPEEDIEYYPDRLLGGDYSSDKGVYFTSDELLEVPDEYMTPGKKSIVVSEVTNIEDYKLAFVYVYNEDNDELEHLLGDILHTFRDTKPEVKEGFVEYVNDSVGFRVWHPPESKIIDGGDYVLIYQSDSDISPGANIYDGVNLRFVRGERNGKDSKELVQEKLNAIDSGVGFAAQPTPITVGELSGYYYDDDTIIEKRYIYLDVSDTDYLLIVNSTGYAGSINYEEISDGILDSLELVPVKNN